MSHELSYAFPRPPAERPGSVTAMAIIGIIFGSLAFICTPLSLVPYFIPLPQSPQGNPLDAIKNDSMLFGWTIMSSLIAWLLSIFELTGSIGALGLRQWARQILVGWSIIALPVAIAGLVVNAIYLQPKMAEMMRSQANSAAALGGMAGLVLGIVFGIGIPAAMLIVMTRPSVKDAFARGLRPVI